MEPAVWSFCVILVLITLAGVASFLRRRRSTGDYLVASRAVSPWLSALSAVATNNSGFMFIGMIAYSYRVGLESIWMAIAWSALAASLGSVLLLRIFHLPFSTPTAVVMMGVGFSTVVAWHYAGYDDDLFKLLPGLTAALFIYAAARSGTVLRNAVRRKR